MRQEMAGPDFRTLGGCKTEGSGAAFLPPAKNTKETQLIKC